MGFDVVTFGETMGSIRAAGLLRHGGAMSMSLGGAETNVAIGLARLGHSVRWGGRLGSDDVGAFALRTLRSEGVDTATVNLDPARATGLLLIERRVADISRVAYYRANSAGSAVSVSDVDGSFDASTRVLHLTGITPALSRSAAEATLWAASRARELGVLVSLDVNYRGALWARDVAAVTLRRLAALADVVFASDDELYMVAPESGGDEQAAVRALLDAGAQQVVVTRGGDGASAWTLDETAACAAREVRVVDTIGAGDAFTAGYLSALLDGLPLAARLDRGAVLGAFAVSASGDWESLPRRDELDLIDHVAGATIR
ncbi:2-dehydro-3-deoxygluconokinase [Conyzicola nivalis]|uniref:2-dehydro-3-deoxygluconokinase n=1 Tax=Conyzicola nivalis TaxID=1477021 RepID=A0ABV2QMR7_9MICO